MQEGECKYHSDKTEEKEAKIQFQVEINLLHSYGFIKAEKLKRLEQLSKKIHT